MFEWIYGVIIQIYPLCPYPGLYCGGWLCGRGIPPHILLVKIPLLNQTFFSRIFELFPGNYRVCCHPSLFSLRVYSTCYASENDCKHNFKSSHIEKVLLFNRLYLSFFCRMQNAIIITIVLLLALNVVGFSLFGQQTKKTAEILRVRAHFIQ